MLGLERRKARLVLRLRLGRGLVPAAMALPATGLNAGLERAKLDAPAGVAQRTNSNSNAISSEKMPKASARAKPRNSAALLAVGGRGIAQGARQELSEDASDADGGAAHADTGKAGGNVLRSDRDP